MSKILSIAQHLADRVKTDKRPYSTLQWIVSNCEHQYKATESELIEAHLAAINILKQAGVENAKRKPLTNLSKQERALMRKSAKELAAMMEKFLQTPVAVTKSPIQVDREGNTHLQIEIKRGTNLFCSSYFYPTHEELTKWASMDEANRTTYIYKFAQSFKFPNEYVRDNAETIRTQLEALL